MSNYNIRRVGPHHLADGSYEIMEDRSFLTSSTGPRRSLAIRPLTPSIVKIWLPMMMDAPEGSTVGTYIIKTSLDSDSVTYHYGITHKLEFASEM